jgi:Flp pilus assembly protein TadG
VRRRLQKTDGQATLEMALVLPILIWLMLGMVDVARMANTFLIIQHASREAVRLGVTGASDDQVATRVFAVAPTLDPSLMTVAISPAGVRTTGSDITVKIDYRYPVLAIMAFVGAEVPLTASLTARVE